MKSKIELMQDLRTDNVCVADRKVPHPVVRQVRKPGSGRSQLRRRQRLVLACRGHKPSRDEFAFCRVQKVEVAEELILVESCRNAERREPLQRKRLGRGYRLRRWN